MNRPLRIALAVAGLAAATHASATITFYEREGFQGRSFATAKQVGNFERIGFNDRASSAIVTGERWEVCDDARFAGNCTVLRPGQYGSLAAMGLNDRVSSVRIVQRQARVDDNRYAPAPVLAHDYRRRNREQLYQAEVTSARAVMGRAEQRCWVEREQMQGSANSHSAMMGAVIGGILGHQVGNGGQPYGRDVQKCASVPGSGAPDHWDITYNFRGQQHRMQMAQAPGRTVTVNAQGEPRA